MGAAGRHGVIRRRILHVPGRGDVNIYVKVLCLLALLCPLTAADLRSWIGAVERRYNSARTMEAAFDQSYLAQGRKRVERGQLSLRKPGRMRWEYTEPAGKLFIADGKWVWMYSPATGKAERAKLKASDDERAPLAFLPKSDKVPYTSVEFTVSRQGEIRRLKVSNGDGSITEYLFANERMNSPVNDAKFVFTPPPGVPVEEITEGGER
jgi:outer membrane lipoprotein carrier protein